MAEMEHDICVGDDSFAITVEDPFRMNLDSIVRQIDGFLASHGTGLNGLDIRGLLPRLVKGIAGCEGGCPSDARSVVKQGFQNFKLDYVEGGILTATAVVGVGKALSIKLFPDFYTDCATHLNKVLNQ